MTEFSNGKNYENYIGSGFDTASTSYYDSLNTKVKAALAAYPNVVQGAYNYTVSTTKTLDPSATFSMTYFNVFGGTAGQQYANYYRIAGKVHREERYVTLASALDLLPVLEKDSDGFYTGEDLIDKVITTIDPSDLSGHINKYRLQTIDVCPTNSGSGLTRPTFGIECEELFSRYDSRFYELNRANSSDALFKIHLDLRKVD